MLVIGVLALDFFFFQKDELVRCVFVGQEI